MITPKSVVSRLTLIFALFAPILRGDLLVVIGDSGGYYDPALYRYDEVTGASRGTFGAMNEGWFGLCCAPSGNGYVMGNTLGRGDLYGVDPHGLLIRGPLWRGPAASEIGFGPDGYLYGFGSDSEQGTSGIVRYDSSSGESLGMFAAIGGGGTTWFRKFAFGPDGNLYVISDQGIVRFRGGTGAFMDVFVPLGTGGLANPTALIFGPDGNLYVASGSGNSVKRFNGGTGAAMGDFIAAGTGGLNNPVDLTYGPDGRLYVASYGSNQVLRFDATSGAFHSVFVTTERGPRLIAFDRAPGAGETIWFDDSLPAGAVPGANGGDAWNWVSEASPEGRTDTPVFGTKAHRSASVDGPGVHEHFFNFAQPFPVATGDILFVYAFVPSSDEPYEIMLSWKDEVNWEHRAFWGYDMINAGTAGTASRRNLGVLTNEYVGRWVRLEVPASLVGLEGHSLRGMSFSLVGGSVTWDRVGKLSAPAVAAPPPPPPPTSNTVWFDDAFPQGASWDSTNHAWTWHETWPTPRTGTRALEAPPESGRHEAYFNFAWTPLALGAGDVFYIYVYLFPDSPPRELVISFCADNWEHRAYWGENLLHYAVDNTPAQRRIGDLPAAGQWVRLEVPASAVGLEGQAVKGLSLTLSDGRALFDQAGKIAP